MAEQPDIGVKKVKSELTDRPPMPSCAQMQASAMQLNINTFWHFLTPAASKVRYTHLFMNIFYEK